MAAGISAIGSMLTLVAIPLFVLETTGSAARTGISSAFTVVSFVAAGILAGPLIDRVGHKRASIVADLTSGAAAGAIPLLYQTIGLPFWSLLVLPPLLAGLERENEP